VSAVRPETAVPKHSALSTVRRLIVLLLLFALVLIGTSGLGGLLERLFSSGAALAARDVGGLARSLAFAVIGGSLAAVLWWVVWRRLRETDERSSLAWGLYVTGVYAVALITFSTALLGLVSSVVGGDSPQWYSAAATSLVWAAVWGWHRWMWLHPAKGPGRLAEVPTVAGSVFGLLIGTGGAVTALGTLLDSGLQGFTGTQSIGAPWWVPALQALVWAAGGAAVWWWHWIRGRGRHLRSGLANVALAVVGVLGGCVLALSGAMTVLFVLLRLAFDRTDSPGRLVEPLGVAVAAAAIGSLVWLYHAALAPQRSGSMRQARRLLAAGAALVAAASGIGVIVNAALGLAETTLAGAGTRTLLLGGISALAVGGPLWWKVWDPLHLRGSEPSEPRRPEAGRRIYLVVVFGISAVVALITLLVIGYQAFEFLLDSSGRASLIGRVRAPLGLLAAAGLVGGYHYGIWKRYRDVSPPQQPQPEVVHPADRPGYPAGGPTPGRGVRHVILVTGMDPAPWIRAISEATGAEITVWRRADIGRTGVAPRDAPGTDTAGSGGAEPDTAGSSAIEPEPGRLARTLEEAGGEYVLVVVGRSARIDVIPLAADPLNGMSVPGNVLPGTAGSGNGLLFEG
jgi:hypothetical protein